MSIGNKKRRHPDSNWGIRALQAPALPLGHVAVSFFYNTKYIIKSQVNKTVIYKKREIIIIYYFPFY